MKTVLTAAGAATAILVLVAASQPAGATGKTTKLSLAATTTSSMRVLKDVAPAGWSNGDVLQYTETLSADHRDAGSDVFNLTLGPNSANVLDGYWLLAGGALHVHGIEQCCNAPFKIPVVAGTGIYQGMHGSVVIYGANETFTLTRK